MPKRVSFALMLCVFTLGIIFVFPNKISEIVLPSFENKTKIDNLETTIILTGDIMLGRSVMETSLSKDDPSYPFLRVAEVLKSADLVFGNLETPIIKNCPRTVSGMIFCTSPEMLFGLKYAGVDIVSLANNHTKNYGDLGFIQTKNFLSNEGLDYVGDGNLIIRDVHGTKFGFLGFNFVDTFPKDLDVQLIKDAKAKLDVLVVMVHWGKEYMSDPTSQQKEIADTLIKAGADVIVGNHPHWVQGYDIVDGKPIFYSLGNFIFDQAWSEETKTGIAVCLTYQKDKLIDIEEMPIYMKSFAQPEWIKQ